MRCIGWPEILRIEQRSDKLLSDRENYWFLTFSSGISIFSTLAIIFFFLLLKSERGYLRLRAPSVCRKLLRSNVSFSEFKFKIRKKKKNYWWLYEKSVKCFFKNIKDYLKSMKFVFTSLIIKYVHTVADILASLFV